MCIRDRDNVEIALHDLTSKEQEIVAIANNHNSGREIGAKDVYKRQS